MVIDALPAVRDETHTDHPMDQTDSTSHSESGQTSEIEDSGNLSDSLDCSPAAVPSSRSTQPSPGKVSLLQLIHDRLNWSELTIVPTFQGRPGLARKENVSARQRRRRKQKGIASIQQDSGSQ